MKGDKTHSFRGMTPIEGLILLLVFSVGMLALLEGFNQGLRHVTNAKDRILAVGIANEKMELLRSLPYEDVAVAGGVPDGSIDPDEYVTRGSRTFHVITSIMYIDDPEDGTYGGSPNDSVPNDYKLVHLHVGWGDEGVSESVEVRSHFVPSGLETASGGGILSINIIDEDAQPVSGAMVHVQNSEVSPSVNTFLFSDSAGNVTLVGAPASSQAYRVSVSKLFHKTAQTYAPYPTTAYYPNDVHMTAVDDTFTSGTIVLAPYGAISVTSLDAFGDPVPNVDVDMEGGRELGTDVSGDPVYNFTDSIETDGMDGEYEFLFLHPGLYTLSVSESGYQFWKVDYGSDNASNEILLPQGSLLSADIIMIDESVDGLFALIQDDDTEQPVVGATVRLENTTLSYDVEETTDTYGYVYFPRDAGSVLTSGETYDITISHDDYDTETDSVTINTGLNEETYEITAS